MWSSEQLTIGTAPTTFNAWRTHIKADDFVPQKIRGKMGFVSLSTASAEPLGSREYLPTSLIPIFTDLLDLGVLPGRFAEIVHLNTPPVRGGIQTAQAQCQHLHIYNLKFHCIREMYGSDVFPPIIPRYAAIGMFKTRVSVEQVHWNHQRQFGGREDHEISLRWVHREFRVLCQ